MMHSLQEGHISIRKQVKVEKTEKDEAIWRDTCTYPPTPKGQSAIFDQNIPNLDTIIRTQTSHNQNKNGCKRRTSEVVREMAQPLQQQSRPRPQAQRNKLPLLWARPLQQKPWTSHVQSCSQEGPCTHPQWTYHFWISCHRWIHRWNMEIQPLPPSKSLWKSLR